MKKLCLLILSLFILSCSEDDSNSNCSNGLNETWFESFKDELDEDCSTEVSIFRSTYDGKTAYFSMITDPRVNFVPMLKLYDCNGSLVADLNSEESIAYLEAEGSTNTKIYTCTSST